MGCNRTKEDWSNKIGTAPFETNYHSSNPYENKVDYEGKERQESHTLEKISYEQDYGYA